MALRVNVEARYWASLEDVARLCHEVNRGYRAGIGEDPGPRWEDAPEEMRASARAGVRAHLLAPGGLTPEAQHEAWAAHKHAAGWVWGRRKDPDRKEHPCLVPYAALPPAQRAKDHLFAAVVRAARRHLPPEVDYD